MTITKLSGSIKPLDEVDKINELVDGVNTNASNITGKQATLVSGTNIKTVNSTSLLGSGNIAVQATLVSGTNIKTVNSTSLLGSGNVAVQPTLVSGTNIKTVNSTSLLGSGNIAVQPTLVSGTNIKTVNGTSLLGSGDITVGGGLPSQTGKAGLYLKTDGTDVSWEGVPGKNIGEIVSSTIPLTDAGLHLLDGSLIQGSGIYSAFVTYIAGLVSTYPDLFVTESDWQQSITDYGVCGKFVYDSVNNTVRLPKITGKLDGTTDLTALSELTEQFVRLPNIQGRMTSSGWRLGDSTMTGPFYRENTGGDRPSYGSSGGSEWYFDASRCSSVYSGNGTDTKIHEQAINVLYYIVIATSTKTDIQIDIDQVTTDLNNKVDKGDLQEVQCVIETYVNGTSGYRIWSDGYCEQWGRVSLGQDSSTTVNLLKPFVDTNANVVVSNYHNGQHDTNYMNGVAAYLTSTSTLKICHLSAATTYNWQASGYIEV